MFIPLKNRALIQVMGADALPFLQGLLTQDVFELDRQPLIYSLCLTPSGKFLFDVFLLRAQEFGEGIFLDVEKTRISEIINKLAMYKLRSQIDIVNESENFFVYSLFHKQESEHAKYHDLYHFIENFDEKFIQKDPRHFEMGQRLYSKSPYSGTDLSCKKDYDSHRFELGIAEENEMTVSRSIPLEFSFDKLNAISWTKGCYMGQELTARTYYRKLINKKVVPLRLLYFFDNDTQRIKEDITNSGQFHIEKNMILLSPTSEKAGKILGIVGDLTLCMIRFEHLDHAFFSIEGQKHRLLPLHKQTSYF
jgi:folate-binding protein YgfZ